MEVTSEPIRVQSLLKCSKGLQVPSQYIQPPEARPGTGAPPNSFAAAIPTIDLSNGRDVSLLRLEISEACRDWGAFHVTNHGVPVELLHDMKRNGVSFFEDRDLPDKLKYSCDPSLPASEGYGSRMLVQSNDTVLDWRDYFDHHTLPVSRRDPSKWPEFPHNYRYICVPYSVWTSWYHLASTGNWNFLMISHDQSI